MNLHHLFILSFLLVISVISRINEALITTPETGVKLLNIQGHEAAEVRVPSKLSCSGNGNVTWVKVDVQVSLFIILRRN